MAIFCKPEWGGGGGGDEGSKQWEGVLLTVKNAN